jgi:hypothetical protein
MTKPAHPSPVLSSRIDHESWFANPRGFVVTASGEIVLRTEESIPPTVTAAAAAACDLYRSLTAILDALDVQNVNVYGSKRPEDGHRDWLEQVLARAALLKAAGHQVAYPLPADSSYALPTNQRWYVDPQGRVTTESGVVITRMECCENPSSIAPLVAAVPEMIHALKLGLTARDRDNDANHATPRPADGSRDWPEQTMARRALQKALAQVN